MKYIALLIVVFSLSGMDGDSTDDTPGKGIVCKNESEVKREEKDNRTIITLKKSGIKLTIEGTVGVLIKNNLIDIKGEEKKELISKPEKTCCIIL